MAPCKPRVKRKIKMIKNKKVSKAQFSYIFTINSYIFLFVFMHSGDGYSVVLRKDKKRNYIKLCPDLLAYIQLKVEMRDYNIECSFRCSYGLAFM